MLNFSRKNFLRVSLVLFLPLFLALFVVVVVLPPFLSSILFPPFFMRHKLKYRRVYISHELQKRRVVRAEKRISVACPRRHGGKDFALYRKNQKGESKTCDRVDSAFAMRPASGGRDYAKVQSDPVRRALP